MKALHEINDNGLCLVTVARYLCVFAGSRAQRSSTPLTRNWNIDYISCAVETLFWSKSLRLAFSLISLNDRIMLFDFNLLGAFKVR